MQARAQGATLRARLAAGLLGLACMFPNLSALGATVTVAPEAGALAAALSRAGEGDTIKLAPGIHRGPVKMERSVTLVGEPGSVVDGGGQGRVITVAAPNVTVRGLTIMHSGARLSTEDSGIFVTPEGDGAIIEDNRLEENLIGVYLKGPENARVIGNTIIGRQDLRMNERGNGVQLWNTPGSVIEGNDIRFGRDGIFVTTSRRNTFRDNRMADLRFAIHYMYTNESELSGNVSRGNHIGYALMFSNKLEVRGNLSEGDRDRGLLLNYANNSNFVGNVVRGGPEKCVFIYNANMNNINGNRFEGCDIGIHFTAGLHRQPHPGEVRRHPPRGVVGGRARQLLERQHGIRSRRRRHRRSAVPTQRSRGPDRMAPSAREDAPELAGAPGAALVPVGVPGPASRRRHRQRAAHERAREPHQRGELTWTRRTIPPSRSTTCRSATVRGKSCTT
jgi:nitrous oxidase accessory protein